jgi:hypothetical protein
MSPTAYKTSRPCREICLPSQFLSMATSSGSIIPAFWRQMKFPSKLVRGGHTASISSFEVRLSICTLSTMPRRRMEMWMYRSTLSWPWYSDISAVNRIRSSERSLVATNLQTCFESYELRFPVFLYDIRSVYKR